MERWWPTTEMLDAGITLLTEEWDPIGTRLGGVPVEDIGEYAFYLFGPCSTGGGTVIHSTTCRR
jgi:hypothetical protein